MQKSKITPQNEGTKIQIGILADRMVEADILSVPLASMCLDPNNVRFKHIPTPMTDEQIHEKIWTEADTKDLWRQIVYSSGLTEKPVIRPLADDKFLVVEGNRRTVCLRKVAADIKTQKERNIVLDRIDPVQCIVLPRDTTEKEIALYLARIHVSGKKKWATLNQAAHIHELMENLDFTEREIAKAISISSKSVYYMKTAYGMVLKYHEKYDKDPDWLYKFSYFYELVKKPKLKNWLEDPKNIETFMKWIHSGQIEKAEHVRKLEKVIVDCKEGYAALMRGATVLNAYAAMIQSKQKQQAYNTLVDHADDQIIELADLIRNFPKSKIDEYAKEHDKLVHLESLHGELGSLIKHIKAIAAPLQQ